MDKAGAAAALGMREAEVAEVRPVGDDTYVQTHCGTWSVLTVDGWSHKVDAPPVVVVQAEPVEPAATGRKRAAA